MKTRMNRISSKITPAACALLASLAMLAGPGAFAQNLTDTWVGNTTPNLSDPNWIGNSPPTNGDSWLFGPAGTAGTVLNNSFASGITVSNIGFLSGASAYTFTNNNPIILAHSITNASTNLQTFNVPISNSAVAYWALTAGGGDLNIGGPVSESAGFYLIGPGTLTLTNTWTNFSATTTNGPNITNGVTLILTNAGAIGAYSAPTYTWATGANFSNNGVIIYSSSATNSFGPRTDGNGTIIVNGPGEFISSTVNSWGIAGDFIVNGGIFSNQKGTPANGRSGFGSTANDPFGNQRYITVNGPGIISLDVGTAFGQANTVLHNLYFVVNTNGLFRVTTGSSVFTNFLINGGTVAANGGSYLLQGSIITGGTLPSYMTNTGTSGFTLGVSGATGYATGYQTPFVVNPTTNGSGAGGADLIVGAPLQNSATGTGFTLSGGGTMLLNGTNTFTGPISVNSGTLILGSNGLLNSGTFPGNITVAGGATFIVNAGNPNPQTNTGVMSGAGTVVLPAGTLSLAGTASTVAPLTLVLSNGATLDVTSLTNGTTLGTTIMGFGSVNGSFVTASGAIIEGGIPGTPGTLPINGNLTMAVGADFALAVTNSASSTNNGLVAVNGTLTLNGTQVLLTAPSGQGLATTNYTLVTTTGGIVGSVSPGVIWNIAPTNANHYFATNTSNNVLLAYSVTPIPTPGGVTSPANILRNSTALLIVTVTPGVGTVTNVTVNASLLGGPSKLALTQNGVANQWTNSVSIGPAFAPGVYVLTATATDTTPITGNGIVAVSVVASTETWAGNGADQNFDTGTNWAVETGQTGAYPPASFGDSLVFAGAKNLAPVMDNSYSFNGLGFASGAGSFNVTASSTNVLTMMGGITNLSTTSQTLALPIIGGLAGPEIVTASNGNLTMSGGLADTNNGGLMVIGPISHTFTLAGTNTFTGLPTVRQGTMTLTGSLTNNTNNFRIADTGASSAVFNVGSNGNLVLPAAAAKSVLLGLGPNSTAAMTIGPGGALDVQAGTLSVGNGAVSSDYFNMTGGTANVGSYVYVGQYGDHARFDMSGGTFTISTNCMRIATETGQSNQFGEANFTGGTFNSLNQESASGYGGGMYVGDDGIGVLNVMSNAVLNIWGDTNLAIGVNVATYVYYGNEGLGQGTVNLLGGAIVTAQVAGGLGVSTFNFNGGLLSNYNGSINWNSESPGPAFMYNVSNAYIYSGGAFIDDGGGNIIINEPLQPASGYGVASIAVNAAGAGYIAPPYVYITGGSGKGATASAIISTAGAVTGFRVTCPGTGYASGDTLTVSLSGGGYTTAATAKAPVLALNTSGGLTYTSQAGSGTGTLTLTGPATYTNATIVQSGTLAIGAGGSINNSAVYWVSNGATLNSIGAGGLILGANQALKGSGAVTGPVTAISGSSIYPGADPAVGKLTFNSGLNMSFGSIVTFDLSSSFSGANDQVVINGNQSVLSFANNSIHIKAASTSSSLDTSRPYTLFQNNSGMNLGGLPNPTPVFDVAPVNATSGYWLIQPNGTTIVLKNSSTPPPGGSGSITSGATSGTNVIRNVPITVSATISGPNPVQSVTVDLSAYGGAQTQLTHGAGNTWSGTLTIPSGTPPGPFNLTILAFDGALYGEVSLPLNVLTTADTWSGADAANSLLSDDNGNWVGGAAPGFVGDSAIFAGTTGLAPILDQNYTFNGIGFASNAGPFVLSSFSTIGVTGGITNNSTNNESVNFALTLTGANMFVNGAVGNLVLSNTVSGSGQLNVAGAGSVTLDGTVSYTGNTLIAPGGTLIMGVTGQWQDPAGNGSYDYYTTNNGTFVYNSPGTQTNQGIITGGAGNGIIVNGPGMLCLNNAGNTFTNNVVVNGGELALTAGAYATRAISALGNQQVQGRMVTINNGGVVTFNAANVFAGANQAQTIAFTVNQGGLLQVIYGGENEAFTNIYLNGGTLYSAAGLGGFWPGFILESNIYVGGSVPSYMSASTVGTIATPIGYAIGSETGVGYQMGFVVSNTAGGSLSGPFNPDLIVSGSLFNTSSSQNASGFIKSGGGTMALTGTNFFSGPITVASGAVILGGGCLLNFSTNIVGSYAGNIAISNGATFAFASSNAQTLTGVLSGAGTLLVNGTNAPSLTLATPIPTNTVTNIFTGTAVINSGILFLTAGSSFSNASGVSIAGGAIFDVSQLASPYVWPATGSVIASGTAANPATINSGGAVSLSSSNAVVLTYDDTDAAPQPALNINGNLTLGGNAFTVNTADGQPLAKGTYVLIQASGTITSSGTYPAVTGTAIGSTLLGAITVNGSQVLLTVSSSINTTPPPIQFSRIGNVLTLSWPTNSGWTLESNSINVGVPADWFRITGSSAVTNFQININAAKTNVFYRLVYP